MNLAKFFRRKQPDLPNDPTSPDIVPDSKAAAANGGVAGDSPIVSPGQDAFGIDPFAKTLAASIAKVDARDGLVFAINGAWGSGKSSAINLVVHHLQTNFKNEGIVVVTFNPWWFNDYY